MAKTYQTPGVYVEEVPSFPPSVAQVETAIPVFIAYTIMAGETDAPLAVELIDNISITQAKRITSLLEYEIYFGEGPAQPFTVQIDETYGADNGLTKRTITVTNAPSISNINYHMRIYFDNGGGPCYIISVGNSLTDNITAANLLAGLKMAARCDEVSLLVIPQVNQLPSVADSGTVYDAALQQAANLQDRFVILDCYDDNADNIRQFTGTTNLKYGAAYHPFLQTAYISNTAAYATIAIKLNKIVAGGTEDLTTVSFTQLSVDVQQLIIDEIEKPSIILPPCSAVAGIYATVDNSRGVWKSPANVSLNMVAGLTKQLNNTEQDSLTIDPITGKSINAIRAFIGEGILVWGARTLAGNDDEWRYISVTRLFIMVQESVKKAIESFVFEPNDAATWTKIQNMLNAFLTTLWREGALQGEKPELAFYTAIGLGKTMTVLDINNGLLILEMGLAAIRPSEFITIRLTQQMSKN